MMMSGLFLALALSAQSPMSAQSPLSPMSPTTTPSLPPGLGRAPLSFGATVVVEIAGVKAPAPRKAAPAKQLDDGRRLYAQRCAMCHGDAGAADGVGARRIKPEPQHLNDVIWQGAVSDAEIEKAILDGGAAVSRSPMMPANPDLKKKPALAKALVAYVRSLRAPFGSVTSTATFPATPTREPIVMRADADKEGRARVTFPSLPKGKATIMVMVDDQGTVGCTLEVDVKADTTLTCPPPAPRGP